VFDEEDRTLDLTAVYGFATREVRELQVDRDGKSRRVPIRSGVGAFVVLAVGVGRATLSAVGADGGPLGDPRRIEP
jgi:hypothetical protein